jgi:hypothetical protein
VSNLSGRQYLELDLLCADYRDATDLVPPLAALARYVLAERIVPDDFDARDGLALNPAYTAALIVHHHTTIAPGCLAGDVLLAIGMTPMGRPDPADE